MARDSRVLLERISRLRKSFEEARAHGKTVVSSVGPANGFDVDRSSTIVALGEMLQTTRGSEIDALPSPAYLTQGMRQVLNRTGMVAERLHWLAADVPTRRGLTKGSATAAVGAIVRSVATLPDSVAIQDQRLEGLVVQVLLLEQLTDDLEASQATSVSRKRHLLTLMRLQADLHADEWVASERFPETSRLEPVVAKVLELAQRTTWREEGLWIPTGSVQDRALLIAADGWNVALVMARACLCHACPSGVELEEVILAGLLHDTGMLAVPETQMNQIDPWSPAERGVMEGHARRGARILERWLPGAVAARGMVLWHHERPDGTGYPDALLGLEIPELARLGAVADMVCGLLLPRGSRPATAWEEAVRVAVCSAGVGLLDPDWVNVVAGLGLDPNERLAS